MPYEEIEKLAVKKELTDTEVKSLKEFANNVMKAISKVWKEIKTIISELFSLILERTKSLRRFVRNIIKNEQKILKAKMIFERTKSKRIKKKQQWIMYKLIFDY